MWCPRCNKEYEESYTACPKCGCELEDYAPILNQEERDMMMTDTQKPQETVVLPEELEPELLVSVVGEAETLRLVALLEGLRIPCIYRLTEEEEIPTDEWEESAQEEWESDLPSEDFDDEADESDEPIYDILIPKAMIPKALRILNEDSRRREEELLEEEELPEFDGKEFVEYSPFDDDDEEDDIQQEDRDDSQTVSPADAEDGKKKKGFFGLFGRK